MARGYPDFFGFSIVPKYGTPVYEQKLAAIVATLNWENIFTCTGKGRTYGGYIYTAAVNNSFTNSYLRTTIDGVQFNWPYPKVELDRAIYRVVTKPFSLTAYFRTALTWEINWTAEKDFTFGQSFIVDFYNGSAGNVTIDGIFMWGQVV